MAFPKTIEKLRDADYKFSEHGVCRGCRQEIEWWLSPKGRPIPMNPMTKENGYYAESHFATCPTADSFRKR